MDKTAFGKSKELTIALRKENFKVGNFGEDFNTMSRTTFRNTIGRPAQLD